MQLRIHREVHIPGWMHKLLHAALLAVVALLVLAIPRVLAGQPVALASAPAALHAAPALSG
jgi:hypothetical protein